MMNGTPRIERLASCALRLRLNRFSLIRMHSTPTSSIQPHTARNHPAQRHSNHHPSTMPSSSSSHRHHHHKHKSSSSSSSSSSKRHHRHRHEDEDGNESDASSAASSSDLSIHSSASEASSGKGKPPLQPTSGNVKRGGAVGSATKKKAKGSSGMQALAQAVQEDPSIASKIDFLFTAMQEHVLPNLDYVATKIKEHKEEDAIEAKRQEREVKMKRKQGRDSSDKEDERAHQKKRKKGKGKGGGGSSKQQQLIPMKDKWAKALATKLTQPGSLGQAPFTKERTLSLREHYHIVAEDAEALFGGGTLMQPIPHNKPHSALYVYKFWSKAVAKLFSPIPFPLKRQADLYTKEGAAIAAEKKAAKFAKKMEKEGKESAGGGDGGGKGKVEEGEGDGEETEDEEDGSSHSKSGKEEGGGAAAATVLKPCPVVCRWMEARHNRDKLSLTLVFGFEQDPDAEEEEEGSEVEVMD